MNERESMQAGAGGGVSPVTLAAAALVVFLAVGALLWPHGGARDHTHVLLVFDSSGDPARVARVFDPLRDFLGEAEAGALDLVVVRTVHDFRAQLQTRPDFVLAPDGLALVASAAQYLPLAAGRRAAPRNLRPRGVLVRWLSAPDEPAPWRTKPEATVFGDSVSLAAVGVLRAAGNERWPRTCAWGPDPYDHAPALHAMRLGGFSYAVVRQWDAERFFAGGLLDREHFAVRDLIEPVPDTVVLVSRAVPRHIRLRCGEGLSALGRQQDDETPQARDLRRALADLHLTGFNLLLEPDFDLVRKNFARNWLPPAD